jgi:hypothetical protein
MWHNGHRFTIQVNSMVESLFLCLALDTMVLVTEATMFEWWLL